MKKIIYLITTLFISINAATGQNKSASDQAAETIAPYVAESTIIVARIDLASVKLDPLFKRLTSLLDTLVGDDTQKKQSLPQMEAGKALAQMYLSALTKAGASEVYVLVTLEALPDSPVMIVVPLGDKVDEDALTPLVQMVTLQMPVDQKRLGDAIVIGAKSHLEQMKHGKSERLAELKRSFAATGDAPIQLVVIPPSYTRRAIEELVTTLPKEAGGGSSETLTQGFKWGAMGITLPPDFKVEATIQSESPAAAEAFAGMASKLLHAMNAESKGKMPDSLIERFMPSVSNSQVKWQLADKDLDGIVKELKTIIDADGKR